MSFGLGKLECLGGWSGLGSGYWGLGSGPGMSQEPELEEGETCHYKDDASIDPDIALSYIVRVSIVLLLSYCCPL